MFLNFPRVSLIWLSLLFPKYRISEQVHLIKEMRRNLAGTNAFSQSFQNGSDWISHIKLLVASQIFNYGFHVSVLPWICISRCHWSQNLEHVRGVSVAINLLDTDALLTQWVYPSKKKNICFSNSVLGRVRADPTPQTIIIHSCKAMPSTADNTGLTDNLMQGERPHDTQVPETYFLNVGETLVVFTESFWIKSQSQEFYNDFNLFGETHSLKGRIVDF